MPLQDLPPTISVEKAGEILGVGRRTAYRAAARGQLPTLKIGRRLLIPTARLLEMLGVTGESAHDRAEIDAVFARQHLDS